jgi:hypothetical protein
MQSAAPPTTSLASLLLKGKEEDDTEEPIGHEWEDEMEGEAGDGMCSSALRLHL